jgi:hypothetical protein
MKIKRCFNKDSLNSLCLALLVLIYASLQAFRIGICSFDQYHYLSFMASIVLQNAKFNNKLKGNFYLDFKLIFLVKIGVIFTVKKIRCFVYFFKQILCLPRMEYLATVIDYNHNLQPLNINKICLLPTL